MEHDINQIVQAILVASDPTQGSLHQQALDFIQTQLESKSESWKLGLALFLDPSADGAQRQLPQVRFYGLRILEGYLEGQFDPLDSDVFQVLQQALVTYIQSEYVHGSAEAESPFLRNKFTHTLTLFFLRTYLEQWPTFFTDFLTLIQPQNEPSTSQGSKFNEHISLLLFHLVLEISGEVADQALKQARTWEETRHFRDVKVRDAVRQRDAPAINEAILTIVADYAEKIVLVRKGELNANLGRLIEIVEWGVRTFESYVGWIDISLTVTPSTIPLLFSLLSEPALSIRLATSGAFLKMILKGLKDPADKIRLIKVLSLGQVLEALEQKTRDEQTMRGDDTDEGEESYRESLGRLLNGLGLELVRIIELAGAGEDVKSEAASLLSELHPMMLCFLADPYDDTTSTVFPLLTSMLTKLKKVKRSSPNEITDVTRAFLSSTLSILLKKMKWDDDTDMDDIDEDDKHAFEQLRKEALRVYLDSIVMIDENIVISSVHNLIMSTFTAYTSGSSLRWNDVELAIYLVYIFGDITKSGTKGRAAFCLAPAAKEAGATSDYSGYPLTALGEFLMELIRSNVATFPHDTVVLQFFETCARYGEFFRVRKECIVPLLEAMVGPRGVHHPNSSIRLRVFYLLNRFVKEDRSVIPVDVAISLLNGIRDLLIIEVELPEIDNSSEQDLLAETVNNASAFDAQLYLFEVTGVLISLTFEIPERASALLSSIIQPLLDELQINLQAIKSPQDIVPITKVHHIIMALGNVAKGFPDLPSPVPEDYIMPPIAVFRHMTQAIVVSLEAMNVFKVVRDATRFAITRMAATMGSQVTDFIPTLMSNLLAHFEPTELADFLIFIGLLMHRLGMELYDVLNQLVTPLHVRIMEMLSSAVDGTDDNVTHVETKKAYLLFLNNIMTNKLHGVFISELNKPRFESLLDIMVQIADDVSDPVSQKSAFTFFVRCVAIWGQRVTATIVNGTEYSSRPGDSLPGFEQFIYERLVPLAFRVPSAPAFSISDGKSLTVLHEIAGLLQKISVTRGDEASEFLANVFLPSQNCPQDTLIDFITQLRELDARRFRKYFVDFIRASKQAS